MFEVIFEVFLRLLIYLFVEIIGHVLVYSTGYTIIKIVTFGKKPEKHIGKNGEDKRDYYAYALGSICWMAAITVGVLIYFDQI